MKHAILGATALIFAACAAGPAVAAKKKVALPGKFDGQWSIEVVTLEGPCDGSYRYGMQIRRGEAIYPGGDVNFRGRVATNGAVQGIISRGDDSARVSGRLVPTGTGGGTWASTGEGPIGCSGRWSAIRRG